MEGALTSHDRREAEGKQEQTMPANEKGSFAGKVAFVTGAANGIGRAAALAFAREGASAVVADVSEQGNQETARLIEEQGGRARAVRCDVTRAEDVKEPPGPMAHRCFGRRAAIRESAEAQPASNGWPGLSMSMSSGA